MTLVEELQAARRLVALAAQAKDVQTRSIRLTVLDAVLIRAEREVRGVVACGQEIADTYDRENGSPMHLRHMQQWPQLWAPLADLRDWVRDVTRG